MDFTYNPRVEEALELACETGLTDLEIALELDVYESTVASWLSGRTLISERYLEKLRCLAKSKKNSTSRFE